MLRCPLDPVSRGNAEQAFAGFIAYPHDKETGTADKSKIYISWRGTVLQEEWKADADVSARVILEGRLVACW